MEHYYAREDHSRCDSVQHGIWVDGIACPLDREDLEHERPDFAVHYEGGLFPGMTERDIPTYLVRTYAVRGG